MSPVLSENNRQSSQKSARKPASSKSSRKSSKSTTKSSQGQSTAPSDNLTELFKQLLLDERSIPGEKIKQAIETYVAEDDTFCSQFQKCISHILLIKPTKTNKLLSTRLQNFVVRIATEFLIVSENAGLQQVFHSTLQFLCNVTLDSKYAHVRTNTLELICQMLEKVPATCANVTEDTYEMVTRAVLPRFYDVNSATRALAITTLARLQQPNLETETGKACEIIKCLSERALNDPVDAVKIAALEKVRHTKFSIKAVLPLLRHRSEAVQNAAFGFFAKRISSPKKISTGVRIDIVKLGFQTKTEMFGFLLKRWFERLKLKTVPNFLTLFDIEENSEVAEDLVNYLLRNVLDMRAAQAFNKFDEVDGITFLLGVEYATKIEYAFYWRMVFEHPNIPRLAKFLGFLETNVTNRLKELSKDLHDEYDGEDDILDERAKLEFCLQQYINMLAIGYNYFDKDDRERVWMFLTDVLKDTHFTGLTLNLWDAVGKLLKSMFPDDTERFLKCAEFINEILDENVTNEPEEGTQNERFAKSKATVEILRLEDELEIETDPAARKDICERLTELRVDENDGGDDRCNQIREEILRLEDDLELEMDMDERKEIMKRIQAMRQKLADESSKSQSEKTSGATSSESEKPMVVRNLFKIVEFICQVVKEIRYEDHTGVSGMTTRMLEQWTREIVEQSYTHVESSSNPAYRLAVFRAFGLIGCISSKQARYTINMFKSVLERQTLYDIDDQQNAISMIQSIVDFLQVHDLTDLIQADQPMEADQISPAQTFIKSLADIFFTVYTRNIKSPDTLELAHIALSSIIKIFVKGTLRSHMNLFCKLLHKFIHADTSLPEKQMLEFFFLQISRTAQGKRHFIAKPFLQIIRHSQRDKSVTPEATVELVNLMINLIGSKDKESIKLHVYIFDKISQADPDYLDADCLLQLLDILVLTGNEDNRLKNDLSDSETEKMEVNEDSENVPPEGEESLNKDKYADILKRLQSIKAALPDLDLKQSRKMKNIIKKYSQ